MAPKNARAAIAAVTAPAPLTRTCHVLVSQRADDHETAPTVLYAPARGHVPGGVACGPCLNHLGLGRGRAYSATFTPGVAE